MFDFVFKVSDRDLVVVINFKIILWVEYESVFLLFDLKMVDVFVLKDVLVVIVLVSNYFMCIWGGDIFN